MFNMKIGDITLQINRISENVSFREGMQPKINIHILSNELDRINKTFYEFAEFLYDNQDQPVNIYKEKSTIPLVTYPSYSIDRITRSAFEYEEGLSIDINLLKK